MIRFEDLMAARLLFRQLPDQRDVLLGALESRRAPQGPPRSLLADLVSGELLTMEQARYVHGLVEAHKRERALSIYMHLLARDGVTGPHLQRAREAIGAEGDLHACAEWIRERGLVAPEREQQLRFQARLVHDRDMAQQVQQHLATHTVPAPAQLSRSGAAPAEPPLLSSQLIRSAPAPTPVEEVGALVRGTLSDADADLPGPRFRIPDWIDMSDPTTGKQLAGYRILGRVGAGAMGTVYLADRQDAPERPIALKVLGKDAPPDAQGRFKREILANSFFSHPGALDVFDAGQTERGYHYLAMEFFDGEDLQEVLEEAGKLPPRQALLLSRQVFQTLGASHAAGVIHRDVKPANILVSRDYQTGKLMDFGIAIIRELDQFEAKVFHSMEGGVTGTPEYMSPEQASGDDVGESSDLYSMGVVLYQALSGRLPFESETSGGFITCHMIEDPLPLIEADAGLKVLPQELHELVAALLAKEPGERPQSAADVIDALDGLLPRVKERAGTGKIFSFLGWRRPS